MKPHLVLLLTRALKQRKRKKLLPIVWVHVTWSLQAYCSWLIWSHKQITMILFNIPQSNKSKHVLVIIKSESKQSYTRASLYTFSAPFNQSKNCIKSMKEGRKRTNKLKFTVLLWMTRIYLKILPEISISSDLIDEAYQRGWVSRFLSAESVN